MTKRLTDEERIARRAQQREHREQQRAAARAQHVARLAAYDALAQKCRELDMPRHFMNDLTVHAYTELTSDSAPTEYGALIGDSRVDVYRPGELGHYEWLDVTTRAHDYRFFSYTPADGIVERTRDELRRWLAERLDVRAYERMRDAANVEYNEKRATAEMRPLDGLAMAASMQAQQRYKDAESRVARVRAVRVMWCDDEDA